MEPEDLMPVTGRAMWSSLAGLLAGAALLFDALSLPDALAVSEIALLAAAVVLAALVAVGKVSPLALILSTAVGLVAAVGLAITADYLLPAVDLTSHVLGSLLSAATGLAALSLLVGSGARREMAAWRRITSVALGLAYTIGAAGAVVWSVQALGSGDQYTSDYVFGSVLYYTELVPLTSAAVAFIYTRWLRSIEQAHQADAIT